MIPAAGAPDAVLMLKHCLNCVIDTRNAPLPFAHGAEYAETAKHVEGAARVCASGNTSIMV
jgi:hypothetical protein